MSRSPWSAPRMVRICFGTVTRPFEVSVPTPVSDITRGKGIITHEHHDVGPDA